MTAALDELLDLLDLEPIEVNIFRGRSPDENRQRVFGGQVAGQALVAAARTIDNAERSVHSMHAYFLRPGDPKVPILYEVDRIRDGRSFSTRRVVAIQHGRAIFNLAASFHIHEEGLDFQMPAPNVVGPDGLPDRTELLRANAERLSPGALIERPIELRYVTEPPFFVDRPQPPHQMVWFRANGTLPDDPLIHTIVLTYASDLTLLDTALTPHPIGSWRPEVQPASLDHAMWFHRAFRADEWLLYHQDTPSTSGARGLTRGLVYTHHGDLVASVVQEGLIRIATGIPTGATA